MNLKLFFFLFSICSILMLVFFLLNKKEKWNLSFTTSFECGFSSHVMNRNSFSIQYFFISLLFLLLELEFCLMLPFLNQSLGNIKMLLYLMILLIFIFLALIFEWKNNSIEWKL